MRDCADGSSEWAAAMAVSMVVMHRIDSATAAWRTAAASSTAPERGMGVFTMNEMPPEAISSRIGGSSLSVSPAMATSRTS